MNALRRLWTGLVIAVPCAALAVFVQLVGQFAFGWSVDYFEWIILSCGIAGFVLGIAIGPVTPSRKRPSNIFEQFVDQFTRLVILIALSFGAFAVADGLHELLTPEIQIAQVFWLWAVFIPLMWLGLRVRWPEFKLFFLRYYIIILPLILVIYLVVDLVQLWVPLFWSPIVALFVLWAGCNACLYLRHHWFGRNSTDSSSR